MKKKYFKWLYDISMKSNPRYYALIKCLDEITFQPRMYLDENRAEDGVEIRYSFGYENHIPQAVIANELDTRPCSVLELMVALALRMDGIVSEYDESMTPLYFNKMLDSLQLKQFTNDNFNSEDVKERVENFMNGDYAPDGDGGLFYIDPPPGDMRDMEIWEQAMWFLSACERR